MVVLFLFVLLLSKIVKKNFLFQENNKVKKIGISLKRV